MTTANPENEPWVLARRRTQTGPQWASAGAGDEYARKEPCPPRWEGWYDLDDEDRQQRAAVDAMLLIDALLRVDRLEDADAILRAVAIRRLAENVILALLNVTYPVRQQLEARPKFVTDAEAILTERLGASRAKQLLVTRR